MIVRNLNIFSMNKLFTSTCFIVREEYKLDNAYVNDYCVTNETHSYDSTYISLIRGFILFEICIMLYSI
jgi:hypothetical protein